MSGRRRNGSPLPPGCKFWIWPKDAKNRYLRTGTASEVAAVRYRLEVGKKFVLLTPRQSEVLLFLMASPGKLFTASEITDALFNDREDGGPEYGRDVVRKYIHDIHVRCRDAGIAMRLKSPLCRHGYGFFSVSVAESPKAALRRLGLRIGDNHLDASNIGNLIVPTAPDARMSTHCKPSAEPSMASTV